MVGSALVRALQGRATLLTPSRAELNFLDQQSTYGFLERHKPDIVIVAAARVGGIGANSLYPASFLHENLAIASNLIDGSHRANINRLLFLGSSCIYPRLAPQPIPEEALLTGPLEPTNAPYAIAKIAGIKLCQAYRAQHDRDYISIMPCNLYGPGDNYHPSHSHVLPALLRRFYEAKQADHPSVTIWGSGQPLREFLYVDDLASACLHLLDHYHEPMPINVGSPEEVTILELAHKIADLLDYRGEIRLDPTKPDGTPRKKTDTSRLESLGWRPQVSLLEGLKTTLADFEVSLASSLRES
jgi:GDP-L-fucose synthase